MFFMLLGMVIEVKLLQPANAQFPILLTLFGMVIEVKLEQPENALSPMLLMLLGMVIEVKLEQLKNAPSSILFTLLGIITEVKLWQCWKAPTAILVTLYECSPYVILSGITTPEINICALLTTATSLPSSETSYRKSSSSVLSIQKLLGFAFLKFLSNLSLLFFTDSLMSSSFSTIHLLNSS